MDNSENRFVDVFFYGLYMDEEILKNKGVIPRNKRLGAVDNYKLRIGTMATLLRDKESKAYGIVYSLKHAEIEKLYSGSGLNNYIAEALLVETENHKTISALCCNLLVPPLNDEQNKEYFSKLIRCMKKYNLPIPSSV